MYDAPHDAEFTSIEFTMPPATSFFSKTVTMNLSGCLDRAAPAPTKTTRRVFIVKMFVHSAFGRAKERNKEYKFADRKVQSTDGVQTNKAQSRHVQVL